MLTPVGREARGYPAHEATLALARRRDTVELPEGHVGCIARPAEFAAELVRALSGAPRD